MIWALGVAALLTGIFIACWLKVYLDDKAKVRRFARRYSSLAEPSDAGTRTSPDASSNVSDSSDL